MKKSRITTVMRNTLEAMPFTISMWGGKPMHDVPGGGNIATLRALVSRGLARAIMVDAFTVKYISTVNVIKKE